MAHRLGDDTASINGYMSLNPLKVMGLQSLICLALFGIAWGAVPVNPNSLRKKWHNAMISLAGPVSNLVLAFFFITLTFLGLRFLSNNSISEFYIFFFQVAAMANCLLFVFNMLPIPILDGWGVLEPFIPPMQRLDQQKRGTITLGAILILWVTPASRFIMHATGVCHDILSMPFHKFLS